MQFTKPLETYFKVKLPYVFIAIVAIYALALTIEFKYIFTDEFYHQALDNKNNSNSPEKITQFINKDRQSEWVNYPFILIVVLVPSTAISIILFLGSILKEYKVKYKNIFSIVLKAQIVFALNYILSVVLKCLGIIRYDFSNVNNNYGFQSALIFFKGIRIPEWLYFPLQYANLSELIHLLILSFGIAQIFMIKYINAIKYVTLYYGLGLVFWTVLVMFLGAML